MSNQIEDELDAVIKEIERNVLSGIRIRTIFYEYNNNDSIATKFNRTLHVNVLNQLMSAICESLILNIYRCWEDGRKPEFRSFPRARVLLSSPKIINKIRSERNNQSRINLLNAFLDKICNFYNSRRLSLINITRQERIAHSLETARDRDKSQIFDAAKMRLFYQTSVYNELMFKNLCLIWNNTTYDTSDFKESCETAAREFLSALPSFSYSEIDREYLAWRRTIAR